ncbi:hypothetical protein CANINC_000431 [Pichia inconspicua]|uniref:Adenine deaminase n=1 Tax=Pichia inconspicua TaxID=52247 RepID=A0A4T0X6L9_9ASCO|nr:hypothetical protein CANINC_000431 [[Candida] inconspicua]
MCNKTDFLKELPKCEHHVHLEGTLSPDLLFTLAKRNNITLPETFPKSPEACETRYDNFADLQDFLNHYYIGMSVLMTEQDFHDLAWAYFLKAKEDGVHHTETFFDPQGHAKEDGVHHTETFFDPQGHVERGIPIETVVRGFHSAGERAKKELGVSTKLIMCLLRHLPSSDGLKTIADADMFFQNGMIHGLGLDSSEVPFPPELFKDCYSLVKEKYPDVGLTAHAGEEADPSYVTNAIDILNVRRIDHGVQSHRDAELIKRLSDEQIMLSVCPLSNVKLQVVKDVSELPIRKFFESGVKFSLNSDDPAYFGGYILDNYLEVEKKIGFTLEEWVIIAKNGVFGSWVPEQRKAEICAAIDAVYEKFSVR